MILRNKIVFLAAICALLPTTVVTGKGLETLTASDEEEQDTVDEPFRSEPSEEALGNTSQNELEREQEIVAEKPAEPARSRQSTAIENRIILNTGAGFAGYSGKTGAWTADGAADIAVFWVTKLRWHTLPLQASLRYTPISLTAHNKGNSYRGVAEGYHFGMVQPFAVNNGLSAFASLELGYVLVALNQLDEMQEVEKLAEDAFQVSLRGGLNWELLEKVTGGPIVALGFGGAQSWQFGGSLSYIF